MQGKKPYQDDIQIKIGNLDFTFKMNDHHFTETMKKAEVAEHKVKKLVSQYQTNAIKENEFFDKANKELESIFDLMLGVGTYKQLYEQTPSVFTLANIYVQVTEDIKKEAIKKKNRQIKNRERLMRKAKKRRS
ncbi:MAG: hypothetical protein L0J35_00170 [Tetragenococcus halophilus]|nr:hypothetical protein [Tetragenococcus halophilus]